MYLVLQLNLTTKYLAERILNQNEINQELVVEGVSMTNIIGLKVNGATNARNLEAEPL